MSRRLPLTLWLLLFIGSAECATLTHLSNIYRAPNEEEPASKAAGVNRFITIRNPSAITARGNILYIADATGDNIYRYNRDRETIYPLNSVSDKVTGPPAGMFINPDLSFYVADPFGRQVLLFDQNGNLIRRFQDQNNLSSPLAICFSDRHNRLLVADSLFDHIITFNPAGYSLSAFGGRGNRPDQFLHIVDMNCGVELVDKIYLIDQLSDNIKIYRHNGQFLQATPAPEVKNPTAIAADYGERIYISDDFDDTIKIYNRNGLIEVFGGTGSTNGRFRHIRDMWSDNRFLYVADSANDRIQVFVITPSYQLQENSDASSR